MRIAGTLPDPAKARRFADYLTVNGIETKSEAEGDAFAVWVFDDERLPEAKQLLQTFVQRPEAPEFLTAERAAAELKREQDKADAAAARRARALRSKVARSNAAPVTYVLIGISVVLFLAFREGSPLSGALKDALQFNNLGEVFAGQLWRLVTPIFVHYSFMHIFFNMWWLFDLGRIIEIRQSSLRLLVLVLAIAVISNAGQAFISSAGFGGMSGVVYGLLGYLWSKGRYQPELGFGISQQTMTIMLVWLVLGFTGLLGPVANGCHLFGLASGAAIGAFPGLLRT